MNKDIIEKAIKEAREKGRGKIISRDDIYNAILQAGQQNGLSLERQGEAYLSGIQEGIRLVVEWIEEQGWETFRTGYYPSQETWQAQKKRWNF